MRYLLDTNILSDLLRRPQGPAAVRLAEIGENHVATSIVCAGELRFGAVRKGSARLTAEVAALLDAIEILPLEDPVHSVYGESGHLIDDQPAEIFIGPVIAMYEGWFGQTNRPLSEQE